MIRHALRLLMDEEMISNPMDWPNPTANERPTSAYTLLQVSLQRVVAFYEEETDVNLNKGETNSRTLPLAGGRGVRVC